MRGPGTPPGLALMVKWEFHGTGDAGEGWWGSQCQHRAHSPILQCCRMLSILTGLKPSSDAVEQLSLVQHRRAMGPQ